jgi:hypothetical protein
MKIFEIINSTPIVTVEALLIPEFKVLADKKDIGFKELTYVYFASDYKSIYLSYDKDTREERLKLDFIGDIKYKPSKEVVKAIEKYKELQRTPTMRFLEANQNAMESMGKYYNSIDWKERDEKGKPIYDITKISTSVKQVGGIIDNIEKLKDKVAKEQSMSGDRQRGTGAGGLLETEE